VYTNVKYARYDLKLLKRSDEGVVRTLTEALRDVCRAFQAATGVDPMPTMKNRYNIVDTEWVPELPVEASK
jgi:hypothetical protein